MYTHMFYVLLVCLAITSCTYALPPIYPQGARPFYIDCVSSNECARHECCVIGRGRYTIPTCHAKRELGEVCRPNDEATSLNLTYPEGTTVSLEDVHYIMCPCLSGLKCNSNTGICEDPTSYNNLDYYNMYSDVDH